MLTNLGKEITVYIIYDHTSYQDVKIDGYSKRFDFGLPYIEEKTMSVDDFTSDMNF